MLGGACSRTPDSNAHAFIARTEAVVRLLREMTADCFTPGELVSRLRATDAWAPRLQCIPTYKGRTVSIGRFLGSFRLKGRMRGHDATYSAVPKHWNYQRAIPPATPLLEVPEVPKCRAEAVPLRDHGTTGRMIAEGWARSW